MLFKKTIESIVSDITQKIEHLHAVSAAHTAAADVHDQVIFERTKLAEFARKEAARAKAIAEKFTHIISG